MPKNNLYLIGLTGNIACGKSTVLRMLRDFGAHVIDADQITHQVQLPGQPVYDQIVATFGPNILADPGGPIDRRKLGAIVFADPSALRQLEQIVHPAVHDRIKEWLTKTAQQASTAGDAFSSVRNVAVIDAVKLIEAGWRPICDAIWVVTCTAEQQAARLMSTRGMSEAEAQARITAQPPQSEKIAQADIVIDNSGPIEATYNQVASAWRAITVRQADA